MSMTHNREDINHVFWAMGYAIYAWDHVVQGLCEIFSAATFRHWEGNRLSSFLFHTARFDQQVELVAVAVLDLPLGNEYFQEWYEIRDTIRKLVSRRNEIVHSPVIHIEADDPNVRGYFLDPNFHLSGATMRAEHLRQSKDKDNPVKPRDETDSKRSKMSDVLEKKKYDAFTIEGFGREFEELARKCAAFANKLKPEEPKRRHDATLAASGTFDPAGLIYENALLKEQVAALRKELDGRG